MTVPHKKSETYYQDTITFLVEDTLFKVAKRYFVEHSAIFRDMLSVPQPVGQVTDGSSDEHPLVLEGVKARDFEKLLGLAYPPQTYMLPKERVQREILSRSVGYIQPQRAPTPQEIAARKKAVIDQIDHYGPCIELSRRWLLHQIHSECVERLGGQNLTPVDMVVLGKQHHIPTWIHKGYCQLIERRDQLCDTEAEQLGPITTVRVCTLREDRSERKADPSKYMTVNHGRMDAKVERKPANQLPVDTQHIEAMEEVFEDELRFAEQMNKDFYNGVE